MEAADTPFAKSTQAQRGTDNFWFEKWSNSDTPWRALERDVSASVFPQPMFQARRHSLLIAAHLTA
jgi:hypothetical protein